MTDRSDSYRPRLADAYVVELVHNFAAVMVTGPRAAGKTTTAERRAAQVARLDEPGVAEIYRADPDAALRRAAKPLLLDEWQEVPEVLGAVKRAVDRDRTPGQFILTGSVRAELQNETWAGTGRVIRMSMYPLTERERLSQVDRPSFLERLAATGADDLGLPAEVPDIDAYIHAAVRGGFPEIAYHDADDPRRSVWLTSYLDDLVTRDAAMLDLHKDPIKLRRYLTALALNNAGLPTDATLYRAADINAKTAAGYDQLLRNLFVLDIVPAWTTNRLRRLVKAGKRYLIDTGLATSAAALSADAILADSDLLGRWFDAYATAQLRPEIALMSPRPTAHHLRVEAGVHEVDLVIELGHNHIVALEFKAGAAPTVADAKHLLWLRDELGAAFVAGAVVHTGPGIFQLSDRVWAVPLCAMWS